MFSITDLKKGTLVQIDGKPYRVIEYAQKVMGRGGSIVNVRLKSLLDGAVIPKTYKGSDKLEPAHVENRTVQYLYTDGSIYFFMDGNTFEQFELNKGLVDEAVNFLTEGLEVQLQFFDSKVINVELPKNLFLKVTYTENVVKGDTTSSVLKDATLETGLVVKVPAFIKVGDEIKVDTRTHEYLERRKD
jgi:elongation factor P